jgi:hypothetical protein
MVPAEPEPEPEKTPAKVPVLNRPTHHNGVEVVKEHKLASLPNGAAFRISKLELADGTWAHACVDCLFTGETRGDIMAHRNAQHGARYGKKRPKIEYVRDQGVLDLVLPPREDGTPAPLVPLDMTLREIITVAPSLLVLMDMLDAKERAVEQLTEQLGQATISRQDMHKITVYESHQTEIGELRATVARQGNYEEIKEELYALRSWKRKMITRLSQLGFHLSEEDQ